MSTRRSRRGKNKHVLPRVTTSAAGSVHRSFSPRKKSTQLKGVKSSSGNGFVANKGFKRVGTKTFLYKGNPNRGLGMSEECQLLLDEERKRIRNLKSRFT